MAVLRSTHLPAQTSSAGPTGKGTGEGAGQEEGESRVCHALGLPACLTGCVWGRGQLGTHCQCGVGPSGQSEWAAGPEEKGQSHFPTVMVGAAPVALGHPWCGCQSTGFGARQSVHAWSGCAGWHVRVICLPSWGL